MSRLTLLAILLVCTTTQATAGDQHFADGVLGIAWGETLQNVQATFPRGDTWSTAEGTDKLYFTYQAHVERQLFGLDPSNVLVHFNFDRDERLAVVHFLFSYSQRDNVLYRLGETLGHDYDSSNGKNETIFRWKAQATPYVVLRLGNKVPHAWAILTIDGRKLISK